MTGRTTIKDTDGNAIEVIPSSGAMVFNGDKEYTGPFLWLTLTSPSGKEVSAHLTADMVNALHGALEAALDMTRGDADEPLSALDGQAALDEANNMVVRLRASLRDVLSLIADEDAGDGKGELIRDTSRDDAPDYLPRMVRLVKILAVATALVGDDANPPTVGHPR